jgi:ribonuclease P protein component
VGAKSSRTGVAKGAQSSPSSSRPTSERVSPAATSSEAFPKQDRLLARGEFLRVQRGGRKYSTRSLLILVKPNRLGRTRVGIAVSKKYGNSVQRNRIKRLLREVVRRNRLLFPESIDLVFVPKRVGHAVSYQGLRDEVASLFWRRAS